MEYEVIICFETHVELKTETKLFCDCAVRYDAPTNSRVCPVCTGQPGSLPVLNKKAVEHAVRAGIALHCTPNLLSRFARKNYFYPDLPKGYQISQYERPFCENGYLEIQGDDGRPYEVGIKRIHLEEDAGKLVHSTSSFGGSDFSLVDYNRAGVPLLEIVCDHEKNPLRSIQEARSYLEKLRQTLRYIGVSDCTIEKGQFRCDVNVSLRPRSSQSFGRRAEIKNMTSFRFIADALEYEIKRQSEVLRTGGEIAQETRLFDEQRKITVPMRSKEDAPDYRYFPDPDLVEVELDEDFVAKLRDSLPELPDQKVVRLTEEYGIPREDILILTREREVSDFFLACAPLCRDRVRLSRWIIRDLFKLLNETRRSISDCRIRPDNFAELVNLLDQGKITDAMGRTLLREMFNKECALSEILKKEASDPIRDADTLRGMVEEVVSRNPEAVARIAKGMREPVNFLVGQIMRKTRGKADPKKVRDLIQQKLGLSPDGS
ncbi:MAG: Asp-tRNA(Asn)/Glu-tRNA(Gln) amidotransferase subunit GatB [Desulfobacteraceae bacterium]|nr:MAG: Asp-tRNA(Asn)/Glu-tRNA(Gln) amidotransferase subunit GatB [Desulfobacteraceae bacterium]